MVFGYKIYLTKNYTQIPPDKLNAHETFSYFHLLLFWH